MATVGLVLGFEPFAGLPTNPATELLPALDGMTVGDCTVVARQMPVSMNRLPTFLHKAIDEHRPAFLMGMGLASGAPVLRIETAAINTADFRVPDNDGARPAGIRFDPTGPDGRLATWDAPAIVAAIRGAGVPATISHHAGTHCCNLALYLSLGILAQLGLTAPCGFLHLPLLPEQVVWMMQRGDGAAADLPSLPLDLQTRAARAAIRALVLQAPAGTRAVQPSLLAEPGQRETSFAVQRNRPETVSL